MEVEKKEEPKVVTEAPKPTEPPKSLFKAPVASSVNLFQATTQSTPGGLFSNPPQKTPKEPEKVPEPAEPEPVQELPKPSLFAFNPQVVPTPP